jgi:hypothetical protein
MFLEPTIVRHQTMRMTGIFLVLIHLSCWMFSSSFDRFLVEANGWAREPAVEPISPTAERRTASPEAVRVSSSTIRGLTGSASYIPGADTDRAHHGRYNAPGGFGAGVGLIGGPLLDDTTAALLVVPTGKSTVETGPNGPANAAANNYFERVAVSNPHDYLMQLGAFWYAYRGRGWRLEAERIDGACPLVNPTTAEVLQWAANKWGINPLLLYAEATLDGDWDATSIGDDGTSSGVCQVADRNSDSHPTHAWPGFQGASSMLSRENACFNADFFAAHLYSAFHGLTEECPGGDIGIAIQTWLVGQASASGEWTEKNYSALSARTWEKRFFNGEQVPF